jgi:plastocyanin
MSRRSIVTLLLSTLLTLALAACSSGGASSAPSAGASAAPPAASPTTAAVCEETTDPGDVTASIKDFAFDPADITAKVGQVIAFSNTGAAPHTVTLDDGSCTTPNINAGGADGIVINAPGTYPFHCTIHAQMKGTIVVSE